MTDARLPHALDRAISIRALPETVFRFFQESTRFAAWWGEGSSIDPRPGGAVRIVYPNGVEAGGEVVSIDPPREIVFTFGYASGQPFAVGASRVRVRLAAEVDGTRLELRHELPDGALPDEHAAGWRFQLSLFANRAAEAAHERAEERVDGWFRAWSAPDPELCEALLEEHASDAVGFRDAWACMEGRAELLLHLAALRRHVGRLEIGRVGAVRHCQGEALVDWQAPAREASPGSSGTNLFRFDAEGRIRDVVGFWSPPEAG